MCSNKSTDQLLVKRYVMGDNYSFEILLNRHKNRIYSFIFSKIKNRDIADDIFQDALIKVINSLKKGKYNEEGKFLPWVMRITHNLIIDFFRKNSKMKTVRSSTEFDIFDILDDGRINQEELLIQKQIHSDLRTLIERLPSDQKEVLKLRYFEGVSFKKISKITNVSINTALGRMRYALINLRKLAEKEHIDLQVK